jgi:hypothetical protein
MGTGMGYFDRVLVGDFNGVSDGDLDGTSKGAMEGSPEGWTPPKYAETDILTVTFKLYIVQTALIQTAVYFLHDLCDWLSTVLRSCVCQL